MISQPLCLIIGEDDLTERVRSELAVSGSYTIRVLAPDETHADASLLEAGIMEAASLIILAEDDGVNFALAIRCRYLNPKIRIVLRQYMASLGTRIGQMLPNCQAFSLASHCAATYAAAGLDSSYYYAFRYPAEAGTLLGFAENTAADLGIVGLTVGHAEDRLHRRIIALNTHFEPPTNTPIKPEDRLVSFGRVVERSSRAPRLKAELPRDRKSDIVAKVLRRCRAVLKYMFRNTNPILRLFVFSGLVFFSSSFCFFHFVLGKTLTSSAFYVVETMTNVGFGEVQVTQRGPMVTLCAIIAMLGGIIFTSIFIGAVASGLTRAQWIAAQGLRRIRARNHVIICGGGAIGAAVLELLTSLGKRVVIVEEHPDIDLIHRARERDVDLLTGDPSRTAALELCNLDYATAILALTDSDAINLEVALGARLHAPDLPLIVRMHNVGFAHATKNLFNISTYSPVDLCAPIFAALVEFPGMQGKVPVANRLFTIEVRAAGHPPDHKPEWDCIPLCLWRDNRLLFVRHWSEVQPFEAALYAVPCD